MDRKLTYTTKRIQIAEVSNGFVISPDSLGLMGYTDAQANTQIAKNVDEVLEVVGKMLSA